MLIGNCSRLTASGIQMEELGGRRDTERALHSVVLLGGTAASSGNQRAYCHHLSNNRGSKRFENVEN